MKRKWNQCFAIFNWSAMSKLITIKSISICSWLMCTDSTLSYFCDSRLTVVIRRGFCTASDKWTEGAEQTPWMDRKTAELWRLKERGRTVLSPQQDLWFHCARIRSLCLKKRSCAFWRTHPVKQITFLLGGGRIIPVPFRPPTQLTIRTSWRPTPHALCSALWDKGP